MAASEAKRNLDDSSGTRHTRAWPDGHAFHRSGARLDPRALVHDRVGGGAAQGSAPIGRRAGRLGVTSGTCVVHFAGRRWRTSTATPRACGVDARCSARTKRSAAAVRPLRADLSRPRWRACLPRMRARRAPASRADESTNRPPERLGRDRVFSALNTTEPRKRTPAGDVAATLHVQLAGLAAVEEHPDDVGEAQLTEATRSRPWPRPSRSASAGRASP